jgi:hypothetical protein
MVDAVDVIVIIFDEILPVKPFVYVGVPMDVNLLVPASNAVIVNAVGVDEPLVFEFAEID